MKLYSTAIPIVIVFAVSIITLCPAITHADPLDNWNWRNPLPQGNVLLGVAHGNGEFVAVGKAGTILSSPEGATWTQRTSGTIDTLEAVTFGAGIFVAVGGPGTILTSSDGKTWSQRVSGVSVSLNAVCIANESFAVAGSGGTILTSPDGVHWAVRTTGTADDLNGIAHGNGVFAAIGSDDDGAASNSYFSTDGVAWTKTNTGLPFLPGIAFGNRTFLAISTSGSILTSSDGLAWIFNTPDLSSAPFNNISYSDGLFIGWGANMFESVMVTSPDGETWTRGTIGTPGSPPAELNVFVPQGVISAGGTFVAVGARGIIMTSSNGADWTQSSSGTSVFGYAAVSFGAGTFVAVGSRGTISTSPDGMDWTPRSLEDADITYNGVTYGNDTFVAVGYTVMKASYPGGVIVTSQDGINWIRRTSGTTATMPSGAAFGDGAFVVVGQNRAILQSDNVLRACDPGIAINSTKGIVSLDTGDTASVSIYFKSGSISGTDADWWVIAGTPMGWYYYRHPDGWTYVLTLDDIRPAHQGPLVDLSPFEVLQFAGLPIGAYAFYFGIDTKMDGLIDFDQLYLDQVLLNVSADE